LLQMSLMMINALD